MSLFRNNFRLQNRVYFTEIDVIVLDVNYNLAIGRIFYFFFGKNATYKIYYCILITLLILINSSKNSHDQFLWSMNNGACASGLSLAIWSQAKMIAR